MTWQGWEPRSLLVKAMLFRKLDFLVAGNDSESEQWHPERSFPLLPTVVISLYWHLVLQPMMRTRSIAIALTLCFVAVGVCFGQNVFVGTWKLKETKSEFSPGAPKNRTVVYETEGDKMKVTVDSVGGDGKPTHYVWVGKFDGKEYPVIGDPLSDSRSYTVVDEHILGFNVMKGRKVINSGRIVVSADGKSRTVTMSGTNAQGHRVSSSEVYDKQY
jgi:hypothetical protein